jgi:hypothetical protein
MKSKLVVGLAAALTVTTLVVAALAQTPNNGRPDDRVRNFSFVEERPPATTTVTVETPHNVPFGPFPGADQLRTNASAQLEMDRLVRQLSEAKSDADREDLKTKMTQALEKQFDQRQRRHEAEIEALEAQVKKLKDLVRARNENRREIVSRRLEQILREAQGLGW